jgi:hypothetical protein
VNAKENTLTVMRASWDQFTYNPRRQMGVAIYREQEKVFCVGDRIHIPTADLRKYACCDHPERIVG